jgi:hypothetical protein
MESLFSQKNKVLPHNRRSTRLELKWDTLARVGNIGIVLGPDHLSILIDSQEIHGYQIMRSHSMSLYLTDISGGIGVYSVSIAMAVLGPAMLKTFLLPIGILNNKLTHDGHPFYSSNITIKNIRRPSHYGRDANWY